MIENIVKFLIKILPNVQLSKVKEYSLEELKKRGLIIQAENWEPRFYQENSFVPHQTYFKYHTIEELRDMSKLELIINYAAYLKVHPRYCELDYDRVGRGDLFDAISEWQLENLIALSFSR